MKIHIPKSGIFHKVFQVFLSGVHSDGISHVKVTLSITPPCFMPRPTPSVRLNRKPQFLCPLGPATESPEVIAELIAKGADVMRLNMSHASHDWVRAVYARIREAAAASKREIAVLMDLTGPSIRTGDVEQPWQLQVGDTVEFRCKPEATASTHYSVTVNYSELGKDLKACESQMLGWRLIQIKARVL